MSSTTDATREHIDAERLAAWADHGLPAAAAAEVELHLSKCERCQEVLAAFVRSEPAPAVVIPFWARPPVRWSAAGLAAAAALFLMVRPDRSPTAPVHESTFASARENETAIQPSPVPQAQSAPSASPVPDDKLRRDRQASVTDRAETKRTERKEQSAALPAALPPPPRPAAVSQPPVPVTATSPPVPVGAAAPVMVPLGAARVPAMAESVMLDSRGVFEIGAPGAAGVGGRVAGGAAGRGGAAAPELRQQVTPARWRVTGGMRVEHSLDAGATWTVLPMEPALTTPLVAGAAASQSVCWLVGPEGVVLVTTDGRTFRRASLPERVQLVGVTVEDGRRATVIAADGRKFSPVDGGLSWK